MTTSNNHLNLRQLIKRPACFAALGFGAGLSPKAPGTVGTLVAIPLYLLLQPLPLFWYLLATVAAFVIGVWLCQQAVNWLQQEDPSAVVWDEIVGYLVTMIMAPQGWQWLLAGFVLFRLFDIWKPWPVKLADEQVHGGFGIMLDDVIAAVYAAICLQLLYLLV